MLGSSQQRITRDKNPSNYDVTSSSFVTSNHCVVVVDEPHVFVVVVLEKEPRENDMACAHAAKFRRRSREIDRGFRTPLRTILVAVASPYGWTLEYRRSRQVARIVHEIAIDTLGPGVVAPADQQRPATITAEFAATAAISGAWPVSQGQFV